MKKLQYIFAALSLIILIAMIGMSRDSGINCDELLHYNQSVSVLNFYTSLGRDTSALNTPVTHLKFYGQSYDNLTTFLTRLFGINDIYGFRHLMSTLAGWLAIIVTALFAVWLEGYGAGIIVLILFAISPTFLGHAQNNLKDIPFALSYISGLFFMSRFLSVRGREKVSDIVLLILSMAFCLSIRPGGLILICFFFLFFIIRYSIICYTEGKMVIYEAGGKLFKVVLICAASYFAGILFWPFALIHPLENVLESYRVMVHFPDTFRQIFDGVSEYSDFMPWYYLPKSMLITIPLVIFFGILLYLLMVKNVLKNEKRLYHFFLVIATLFPVVLVLAERSNLYSSWRHFLFIYPGIVILSATGVVYLFRRPGNLISRIILSLFLGLLSLHPLIYLLRNHRYAYIYYNQLTGGLRGANGRYETDYYFISQRESSEWLIKYLKDKKISDTITVASNFSVEWFFREMPQVRNRYVRFEERSMEKWDYAIITNRYIPPFQLRNNIWPPKDAIYTVYADGTPLSAVIERKSESSVLGYKALENNRLDEALEDFSSAARLDSTDDMIFYNFAVALYRKGETEKADSMLKRSLTLNPDSYLALMFLGDMASTGGRENEAAGYYEKVIRANRKYPDAYLSLARILKEKDIRNARTVLRECIETNPGSREAINMLGDTYRERDPEIAEKYYEMAKKIK